MRIEITDTATGREANDMNARSILNRMTGYLHGSARRGVDRLQELLGLGSVRLGTLISRYGQADTVDIGKYLAAIQIAYITNSATVATDGVPGVLDPFWNEEDAGLQFKAELDSFVSVFGSLFIAMDDGPWELDTFQAFDVWLTNSRYSDITDFTKLPARAFIEYLSSEATVTQAQQ